MQNSIAHLNDETSQCKVYQKCNLLQAVLMHDQDKFIQSAQVIKQRIKIVSNSKEDDGTGKTNFYTVVNKGIP